MKARSPEMWWACMGLCLGGLAGEVWAAATDRGGIVPLPCAVVLVLTTWWVWRAR